MGSNGEMNPYDLYDGGEIPFMLEMPHRDEWDIELAEDERPRLTEVVYCINCRWRGVSVSEAWPGGCRWYEAEEPDDYDYCSFGREK